MKKYKLFLCLLLIGVVQSSFSQALDWLKTSTSNEVFTSHSFYASARYNNDFYFAGDFWKDLTIDEQNIAINDDIQDGFVVRLDETGAASALWHFKSSDYVRINKIAFNTVSETLIITGYYRKNMFYEEEAWYTPFFANGFVMSVHPDGALDWFKALEPQNDFSSISGEGLAVDAFGNIYLGLEVIGTVQVEEQVFSVSEESGAVLIAKLDTAGTLLETDFWITQGVETWIDIIDMEVDAENQLITAGCVLGTMEIADSNYVFSSGTNQNFIIKQDQNLTLSWLKSYPAARSHVNDVYLDGTTLVMTIQYNTAIEIDDVGFNGSGSWGDMAVVCIDKEAQLKWAKNFTLSENSGIWSVVGYSIAAWRNQYYIGGMYQGDVVHEGNVILDNTEEGNTYQYPFILSLTKEGELMSTYDFVGSDEPGLISNISANASHLLFAGDYSGQIAIGDTAVSTINSALFYGALRDESTAINGIDKSPQNLVIYPNPVSDFINIDPELGLESIAIFSATGRLLERYTSQTNRIDVKKLPKGHYLLQAEKEDEIYVARFIKE